MSEGTNRSEICIALEWDAESEMWQVNAKFPGQATYSTCGLTENDAMNNIAELIEQFPIPPKRESAASSSVAPERSAIAAPSTSAVEAAAQRTLDLMPEPKPGNPPGDVILTVTVIMLIVKLVIVAYNCWKDHHKTVSIVYEPNWIQRLYLRRVVKKVLAEHGQLDKLNDVMAALLQMAKASTPEDIQAIFDEARSDPAIWTTAAQLKLV